MLLFAACAQVDPNWIITPQYMLQTIASSSSWMQQRRPATQWDASAKYINISKRKQLHQFHNIWISLRTYCMLLHRLATPIHSPVSFAICATVASSTQWPHNFRKCLLNAGHKHHRPEGRSSRIGICPFLVPHSGVPTKEGRVIGIKLIK